MATKLYLFTYEKADYDENEGFVIAANSQENAVQIANENCKDEGMIWGFSDVICTVVGLSVDSDEKVILRAFRAG